LLEVFLWLLCFRGRRQKGKSQGGREGGEERKGERNREGAIAVTVHVPGKTHVMNIHESKHDQDHTTRFRRAKYCNKGFQAGSTL